MNIKDWVRINFSTAQPKLFLELGAHCGEDTAWLAQIPAVTIHAFEPDPRNKLANDFPNVIFHPLAIAEHSGIAGLLLSQTWETVPWTWSSSLRKPGRAHYNRWPISFGDPVPVTTISLDDFYTLENLGVIDFIWCDIQGMEGDMIKGGQRALAHTRYLYTEYSDQEEFEGQLNLQQLLELLPGWSIVDQWPDDVLLRNDAF